jgi:hypothetical protein
MALGCSCRPARRRTEPTVDGDPFDGEPLDPDGSPKIETRRSPAKSRR